MGRPYGVMLIFTVSMTLILQIISFKIDDYLFHIWDYVDEVLGFFIILGVVYLWAHHRYYNPKKFKKLFRKFENVPRWFVKAIGYLYPVLLLASIFLI